MQLISTLKSREIGIGGQSGTLKGNEKINLNFAFQRLASQKEDLHMLNRLILVMEMVSCKDSASSCGSKYVISKIGGMYVPPFACKFCNVSGSETVAAVATEDGDIILLDTAKRPGNRVITYWNAHRNAIFDVSWFAHEQKLISVSGDHKAALWDVLGKKCLAVFSGHMGTVKCVDLCPTQNAIFATGSRDGSVRIWDIRSPKKDASYKPEIIIQTAPGDPVTAAKSRQRRKGPGSLGALSSVTSLVFQNEHHVASSGPSDGLVKIWDLRKNYSSLKKQPKPQYELSHGGSKIHGFTSLAMDSTRTHLYAGCTNSIIYHYDCHSYNPQCVNMYYGHRSSSYYIKIAVSNDDKYLMSGSGDHLAYIWELSKPSLPLVQLPGHTEEVTAVAWSPLDLKVISCGDDEQVLIWDISADQEEEKLDSNIYSTATPYVSSAAEQPVENSSITDVVVLKSVTPAVPQRRSISPKNTTTKKSSPKSSALSITQWFSPLGSSSSVKKSQKRSTSPSNFEATSCSVPSVQADSEISFSSVNTLPKRRKSDEHDDKMENVREVSLPSNTNASIDKVLSPSRTNFTVDSRVLSPSKLNGVVDSRVLSPSKLNGDPESRVLSPSKLNGVVDSRVLSPSKLNGDTESRVLSPSKLNGGSESKGLSPSNLSSANKVLSPSKANCTTNNQVIGDARRTLNLDGSFESQDKRVPILDESYHKAVLQDSKNKENVFCSEVSPTNSLETTCTSEPKDSVPKKIISSAISSRTSFSGGKSKVAAGKRKRISKKISKHSNKEQKKKAERSIKTYFFTAHSGSHA